jgi:hypothetical protein
MSSDVAGEILKWLTAAGVGAVLLAVVNGLFSKRKLSADATKVITEAASGVVERLTEENARVIASNIVLAGKVEALQTNVQLLRDAIAVHAFWDQQAFNAAKAQGLDLPEPPPLHITPGSTP